MSQNSTHLYHNFENPTPTTTDSNSNSMLLCFGRSRLFLFEGIFLIAVLCTLFAVAAGNSAEQDHNHGGEEETEIEPAYAVLFPSFSVTVGVVVFYVLSRYIRRLPYTAVMFLVGIVWGVLASVSGYDGHVTESARIWFGINFEVLLLVFLPGLLIKDAMSQSVHLFVHSLSQLLIFAFPMVLGGMTLAALVGYYILPYGWSFNLCLTFGSILAATDPVAVAALLEEVGAPPRLKVHIAGESLLNDGSAIVFFTIFSERFIFELRKYFEEMGHSEHLGEDIDLKKGIVLFCQKALGGVGAGSLFGLCLLFSLCLLNRRFSREENVVQVTALIGIGAYLNYYVSDFVWKTSGVIATVTAGLLIRLCGDAMINDPKLLDDFMSIVEHLLNTILFLLGGSVWGSVIVDAERNNLWTGKDWGYLILLYVLLQVIRAILFVAAYPITSRIGLKTNWKETAFQIYGGLRGAVGIALALALDSHTVLAVNNVMVDMGLDGKEETPTEEAQTSQVFIMVGGIALLTLVVNGTTAGPLLKYMGLADSTDSRKRIVEAYKIHFRASVIDNFVRLMAQSRFRHVNFLFVKEHVPYIADLTKQQLKEAVQKHKDVTPSDSYLAPYLGHILPHLAGGDSCEDFEDLDTFLIEDSGDQLRGAKFTQRSHGRRRVSANIRFTIGGEPLSTQELRLLFVSVLKGAYDKQTRDGELVDSHFLAVSLYQSLDFVASEISNNATAPLNDWECLLRWQQPYLKFKRLKGAIFHGKEKCGHTLFIERSLAVMNAHRQAEKFLKEEFQDVDSELSTAGQLVVRESQRQYRLAEEALERFDPKFVEMVVSRKFCRILLTAGITYIEGLVDVGLLKEAEAEPFVEELEEYLEELHEMHHQVKHKGEEESTNNDSPREESYSEVIDA